MSQICVTPLPSDGIPRISSEFHWCGHPVKRSQWPLAGAYRGRRRWAPGRRKRKCLGCGTRGSVEVPAEPWQPRRAGVSAGELRSETRLRPECGRVNTSAFRGPPMLRRRTRDPDLRRTFVSRFRRLSASRQRHHRQHNVRRMPRRMVNRLLRHPDLGR